MIGNAVLVGANVIVGLTPTVFALVAVVVDEGKGIGVRVGIGVFLPELDSAVGACGVTEILSGKFVVLLKGWFIWFSGASEAHVARKNTSTSASKGKTNLV